MDTKAFLESIRNRDDKRWGHPELEMIWDATNAQDLSSLYDMSVPLEERKAMAEAHMANIKALSPLREVDNCEVRLAPGCPEEPDAPLVHMEIAYPSKRAKKMPCLFYIMGGGLTDASPEMYPIDTMAEGMGVVVVIFRYRIIFDENGTYPAAINDCHAAYEYLVDNADELGIDPDRIVITGGSTGGHLGLSLCHRLKRYGYSPRGCVVTIPVIDDRMDWPSSLRESRSWGGASVKGCADNWFVGVPEDQIGPEAFANRATVEECIGLPPTFIHTMEHDPCVDPCMAYASKLIEAGVYVECHEWGGSGHTTLYSAAGTDVNSRFIMVQNMNIMDCFKYDLRRK